MGSLFAANRRQSRKCSSCTQGKINYYYYYYYYYYFLSPKAFPTPQFGYEGHEKIMSAFDTYMLPIERPPARAMSYGFADEANVRIGISKYLKGFLFDFDFVCFKN
jgi:hypothetical protein